MGKLFQELRRRNVFRVAGLYAVVGWLLIQIIVAVKAPLGLPGWTDTFFIVLVLAGFPIAMLFAWAFEMTPDGMKRTADVPESESIAAKTGSRLDFIIIGGLALVGVLIIGDRLMPEKASGGGGARASNGEASASVAVLPFIDLSPDGDQEFFSDGISEEILNVLVRIPKLKVAGRTSSFSFKGQNEDLREIGAALGVDHVLEGSVRKSGTKLRITAQLIRSNDGFHMWSETYDRELTDVFDIQDDIARAVAGELALSLGLGSGESLVKDRTSDVVAYEEYLKARKLFQNRGLENLDEALLLLSEVSARDPDFAPAWSLIAGVYGVYEAYVPSSPPDGNWKQWRAIGLAAANRAIAIDPANAEAYAYLGTLLLYDGDLIGGAAAKDKAIALAPDNAAVLDSAAQAFAALGYISEAVDLATRAVSIDPLVPIHLNTLSYSSIYYGEITGNDDLIQSGLDSLAKTREYGPRLGFGYGNAISFYLQAGQYDEAIAVLQSANDAGTIPRQAMPELLALIDAAKTGEPALLAYAQSDRQAFVFNALLMLKDPGPLIEFSLPQWEDEYQQEPRLFAFPNSDIYHAPRWKEQVRKQGVLALWQSRGFPDWCKPMGRDDFECNGD